MTKTPSTNLTAHDLAEQVIRWDTNASKEQWGKEMLRLVEAYDTEGLHEFVNTRTVQALGAYVSSVKGAQERQRQYERQLQRGVSAASGRPVKPTMSIRKDDGSTTHMLWIEASPQQYVDAVLRESRVIGGRAASNEIRLQVVEAIQADEELASLATLAQVCRKLGVDPDTLALGELGS